MRHAHHLGSILKATLFALAFHSPNLAALAAEDGAADSSVSDTNAANATLYVRRNLVADVPGVAPNTDPKLINPWGASFFPGGPFWISDNGTGVSTIYNGDGSKVSLVVTIPGPHGATSKPTGQVANVTSGFVIPNAAHAPAKFIFATEDGTIAAWNGTGAATQAVIVADNSAQKAIYKGLALGSNENGNFLFATNFRSGKIDVFDANFHNVTLPATAFRDRFIPSNYAPFGIANINGDLFVTYAQQDAQKEDDVPGPGHGFVDVFDTSGRLLRRFAARGNLNSPWGVAAAPLGFGRFGGTVLIGNFGNGRINIFGLQGGFLGQLGRTQQQPFTIPGLWALIFGGAAKSSPDTLYFTAGPDDEKHGLFGSITPVNSFAMSSAEQ